MQNFHVLIVRYSATLVRYIGNAVMIYHILTYAHKLIAAVLSDFSCKVRLSPAAYFISGQAIDFSLLNGPAL